MEKRGVLEEIAHQLKTTYLSDLHFPPYNKKAKRILEKIKNKYSQKEVKDAEEYLSLEKRKFC